MTEQEKEVFQCVVDLNRVWMAKDREGINSRVTDDIIEMTEAPPYRLVGRAEYMRLIDEYVAGPVRIVHYQEKDPIVNVMGEVAVVSFLIQLQREPDTPPGVVRAGKETHLLRKEDGRWKVFYIHWSVNR